MPGAPFLHTMPSYQGSASEGVRAPAAAGTGNDLWGFLVWYVIIGFVIPAAIYGGLRLGGFQFVFRSR